MITIKNLFVKYEKTYHNPEVVAIHDLSMEMAKGSFNVIVGPSGCGKTTLLKAIAGLINYQGKILVDDIDFDKVHPSDRNLAYISQDYALYPHMKVFDNIAFPLKARGAKKKEIVQIVDEIATLLEIKFLYTRKIKELSGGQKQRVALARALVKKPDIYLFDEPLSNISEDHRVKEKKLIKECVEKYQSTAIYVTHNISEALSLADQIFVMDEGNVVCSGTPKQILESNNELVKELFKEI